MPTTYGHNSPAMLSKRNVLFLIAYVRRNIYWCSVFFTCAYIPSGKNKIVVADFIGHLLTVVPTVPTELLVPIRQIYVGIVPGLLGPRSGL